MRTPAILSTLAVLLACAVVAIGCQVAAGIAGLEAVDGVACAVSSDCPASSECQSFTCNDSVCEATYAAGGTPCGESLDDVCTNPDTCDGSGVCQANHDVGAECGEDCSFGMYTPPGSCSNQGECVLEQAVGCSPYLCEPGGKVCSSACDNSDECTSDSSCFMPEHQCNECGFIPPSPGCSCASCDGDTCTRSCDSPGDCVGTQMIDAMSSPGRLYCKDQCNDITIQCMGGSRCEVECDSGGCQNLTMQCNQDGPCTLTCRGSGFVGATMVCQGNACSAVCESGSSTEISQQNCGDSCSCTEENCL